MAGPKLLRCVPLRRVLRAVAPHLPPLNFITLHYTYFIVVTLVTSVIFWASSTPSRSISYTDSLFLTVSAMTLAGLNTVNLSILNTFQQVMLYFLIMMGSAILVSATVVYVRKRAFEKRFKSIVEEQRNMYRQSSRSSLSLRNTFSLSRSRKPSDSHLHQGQIIPSEPKPDEDQSSPTRERVDNVDAIQASEQASGDIEKSSMPHEQHGTSSTPHQEVDHITWKADAKTTSNNHTRVLSMQGIGAHPHAIRPRRGRPLFEPGDTSGEGPTGYSSGLWRGHVGRNSTFHDMSAAERVKLGGCEYQALSILAVIVPLYFVLFQLIASIGLGAYFAQHRAGVIQDNGVNPWWLGIFNTVSAFNNSGMSILDANMTAFQTSYYALITMGLLILAGNTCFPVFLRLIIWTLRHVFSRSEYWSRYEDALKFLLDHPRRCFTNLFPSAHTWWLFFSIVTLNGVDWIAFEVLNIGNKAVTSLPAAARVIDGLFQATAVRSGGFYVLAIPSLRIGLQVLYVIMMYISVYPVVITMRNSNVYEERSLGIYADDLITSYPEGRDSANSDGRSAFFRAVQRRFTQPSYFVSQQLRAQLAHDLWWITLAVLLITIIETSQFERDPKTFSVFNIIFEVISAYGCVGISVGVPTDAYSFCGAWHTLSKLILCIVMIRGRHRGLPVAIDRAILLPGDSLAAAEEEDAQIRLKRRLSHQATA